MPDYDRDTLPAWCKSHGQFWSDAQRQFTVNNGLYELGEFVICIICTSCSLPLIHNMLEAGQFSAPAGLARSYCNFAGGMDRVFWPLLGQSASSRNRQTDITNDVPRLNPKKHPPKAPRQPTWSGTKARSTLAPNAILLYTFLPASTRLLLVL